jgi:hypothetical protein
MTISSFIKISHNNEDQWLAFLIPLLRRWRHGELWFKASSKTNVSETPISIKKLFVELHACHPSYVGGTSRGVTVVWANFQDPTRKITIAK